MKFAVVIEKAGSNYSAYIPELPGCVATGDSEAEALKEIKEAIKFHLDGLKQDGVIQVQTCSSVQCVEL